MGADLRFVADVHLGKLAKWMRMLGFDTAYNKGYSHADIIAIAAEEQRILLSRNAVFEGLEWVSALVIRYTDTELQLKQVLEHYRLEGLVHPFSRCLVCNGRLMEVDKDDIVALLEPNTKAAYHEFWQCDACKRIYWKGSHYSRMLKRLYNLSQ